MKPILYSYWRSSCSYRVRLALNYLQIEYDYKPVHLVKEGGEQFKDEFTHLNPKQEVPVFIDESIQLTESMSILQYLNDKFCTDENCLIPAEQKYQCLSLSEMINTGIQPIQNLKVLKFIISEYSLSNEQKIDWGRHWIQKGFESFERKLAQLGLARDFCLGTKFSLVDCFLLPQVYNAIRFGVELNQFPNIQRIYEGSMGKDFVMKSIPENQIDAIN